MALQVKVLAVKPEALSSIPRTHMGTDRMTCRLPFDLQACTMPRPQKLNIKLKHSNKILKLYSHFRGQLDDSVGQRARCHADNLSSIPRTHTVEGEH